MFHCTRLSLKLNVTIILGAMQMARLQPNSFEIPMVNFMLNVLDLVFNVNSSLMYLTCMCLDCNAWPVYVWPVCI